MLLTICQGAETPVSAGQPPSKPTFGAVSAYANPNKPLQDLTVASIESGKATAAAVPVAVQQAYLKSVLGNSTTPGRQTVSCNIHTMAVCRTMMSFRASHLFCCNRKATEHGLGRQADSCRVA
jgi:hypothetical protein